MAVTGQDSRANSATLSGGGLQATPQNYVSLGDLIDPTKPDVMDLYTATYGDQGITGFLELTGAKKNAGTSDEVEWFEEGRLHKVLTTEAGGLAVVSGDTPDSGDLHVGAFSDGSEPCRLNDVLLSPGGQRLIVVGFDASQNEVVVQRLDGGDVLAEAATGLKFAIIGNAYAQGTDQPSTFYQNGLARYRNPYIITKEMYEVNGSQATNIGWINVGGDYRWYMKNEMDSRKRFMNQREMMLLFSQSAVNTNGGTLNSTPDFSVSATSATSGAVGNVTTSEGYFQAVERRGIVADVSGGAQGTFASMSDIDSIILELDKEGAPAEYAMYLDRKASLDIDDMLANGIATQVTAGLAGQFGAFNNDADMAVKLGFKSFTRGGYTFHKHDWKLLNDPTLAGAAKFYKGAMIPMSQVADAKSGVKAPALQMNYKAAGNYSREMEHWVTGGGVLGHSNAANGKDTAIFNYRSECNLVTRAANQHVVLK